MKTSKRFVDGHYQLGLLWKPGGPQFLDNHQQAVMCLSYWSEDWKRIQFWKTSILGVLWSICQKVMHARWTR